MPPKNTSCLQSDSLHSVVVSGYFSIKLNFFFSVEIVSRFLFFLFLFLGGRGSGKFLWDEEKEPGGIKAETYQCVFVLAGKIFQSVPLKMK